MVKRPFTVPLNSSVTAPLHLSDNVLVVETFFIPPFIFPIFYEVAFQSRIDNQVFFSIRLKAEIGMYSLFINYFVSSIKSMSIMSALIRRHAADGRALTFCCS